MHLFYNDVGLEFKEHKRHGIREDIPPMMKPSQLSVRTDYDNTFRVRAAQLFNVLPSELRSIKMLNIFKADLGSFLEQCPDTPPVTG
jgi:hypothetical protein